MANLLQELLALIFSSTPASCRDRTANPGNGPRPSLRYSAGAKSVPDGAIVVQAFQPAVQRQAGKPAPQYEKDPFGAGLPFVPHIHLIAIHIIRKNPNLEITHGRSA